MKLIQDFQLLISLHSGLIVRGKYLGSDSKKKPEKIRGNNSEVLELEFSISIAKGGPGFGSYAPVTFDDYFDTAAHVLAHEN